MPARDIRTIGHDGRPSELVQSWRVVVAAGIGVGFGVTGLSFYAAGQFVLPLASAFGWSRAAVSGGVLCLLLGTVLTAPAVGRIVDRLGARRVALASMIGVALGFIGLALNPGSLPLFYAGWFLVSVLGCGTTPLIWTRAINGWFDRQRGLALGLMLAGTGLSALTVPLLLSRVIAARGWRAGFFALAAATVAIGLPCVWAWFREPGDVDAGPDGGGSTAQGMSAREAAASPAFWRLLVGMLLVAAVVAGVIVHLPTLMVDRGATRLDAGSRASLIGLAVIVGRVGIGRMLDRLQARLVAGAFLMLPAVACLLLAWTGSTWTALILIGLSAGAEVDLLAYLAGRCFGLRHYAAIYGWLLAGFSLGGGVGPLIAGRVHDLTGSYHAALLGGAVLAIVGAILVGGTKPPAAPGAAALHIGDQRPAHR